MSKQRTYIIVSQQTPQSKMVSQSTKIFSRTPLIETDAIIQAKEIFNKDPKPYITILKKEGDIIWSDFRADWKSG